MGVLHLICTLRNEVQILEIYYFVLQHQETNSNTLLHKATKISSKNPCSCKISDPAGSKLPLENDSNCSAQGLISAGMTCENEPKRTI